MADFFINDDGSDSSGVGASPGSAYRTVSFAIDDIRGAGHSEGGPIRLNFPDTYTTTGPATVPSVSEPSGSGTAICLAGPSGKCLVDSTLGVLWDAPWRYMRFVNFAFDDTVPAGEGCIKVDDQGGVFDNIDIEFASEKSYAISSLNFASFSNISFRGFAPSTFVLKGNVAPKFTNVDIQCDAGSGVLVQSSTGGALTNSVLAKQGTSSGKVFQMQSAFAATNNAFFGNALAELYNTTAPWAMNFQRNYFEGFTGALAIDGALWDGVFKQNFFFDCTTPTHDHSFEGGGVFEDPIELTESGVLDAANGDFRPSQILLDAIDDGIAIGPNFLLEQQLGTYSPFQQMRVV